MARRSVYRFSPGFADGTAKMKDLLGGKGANLAEMSRAGLPVPPGFTITTEVCREAIESGGVLPADVRREVSEGIRFLEEHAGARLGDPEKPLLVSVRSGAAVSMPGMMDTVLDLGLNDRTVDGLSRRSGHSHFAWDCYRRFIDLFGSVVMNVPHEEFAEALEAMKKSRGAPTDQDLSAMDLRLLVGDFKSIYRRRTGMEFPDDPREQLDRAIGAVFRSWTSERAVKYREVQHITGLAGTAVNVQAMVYGNMGSRSGTGVLFTRSPSTGEKALYGEYLVDAQGEDVVAGIRTPQPIAKLEEEMPDVYAQLRAGVEKLERHYRDMQDIEFTVQEGKLWFLQTRHGKRTGAAALRIAVDLVKEGVLGEEEALRLVEPGHVDQVLHPHFGDEAGYRRAGRVLAKGLPASPGAAVGRVVFTAEDAEAWHAKGEKVVLVRLETSPEDVGGMHAAEGILTARGGMTSHAAVVARGWGKPCVAGCGAITIDQNAKAFTVGKTTVREGEWLSLNGTTGEVVSGKVELVAAAIAGDLEKVLAWADRVRRLGVRTNADTPKDARVARELGAQGIGLVRTEHMFFDEKRLPHVRRMILAEDDAERATALEALVAFQRDDFSGILRAMAGLPVTVRLLDPPLHEFLPAEPRQQQELAKLLGLPSERVRARVEKLHEMNPMLGHRGCRLGITYPDITAMQARAIFEAACALRREGVDARPEVMVPLVGTVEELTHQKAVVERVAREVMARTGVDVPLHVGTMIEVPRAALMAGEIAKEAAFFSFGTNDLTQMTFGFSRDDIATFLPEYLAQKILPEDPFQTLDREGVGQLVRLAVAQGRTAHPGLQCGICGEHGGDARSISFFDEVGLDYVSCSPFRVPVARLAAAQAVLAKRKMKEMEGEA